MNMTKVGSSDIEAIGYQDGTLSVRFIRNGAMYIYRDVPITVYRQLLLAPSKGKLLASLVKGKYAYERVEETQ